MSLFATGRLTGVSVNSGYQTTWVTPIFEGYMLPLAIQKLSYGGLQIDEFLQELLQRSNQNVMLNEAKYIKEQHCYVSQDFIEERNNATNFQTTLPDGHVKNSNFFCF